MVFSLSLRIFFRVIFLYLKVHYEFCIIKKKQKNFKRLIPHKRVKGD